MCFATPARPASTSPSNLLEHDFGIDRGAAAALVRVRDNGGGLRPDHKLGLGLTGMRERILALGGSLTIASGDDGVTVEAVVPSDARY